MSKSTLLLRVYFATNGFATKKPGFRHARLLKIPVVGVAICYRCCKVLQDNGSIGAFHAAERFNPLHNASAVPNSPGFQRIRTLRIRAQSPPAAAAPPLAPSTSRRQPRGGDFIIGIIGENEKRRGRSRKIDPASHGGRFNCGGIVDALAAHAPQPKRSLRHREAPGNLIVLADNGLFSRDGVTVITIMPPMPSGGGPP